ncbi:hypothetical protein [Fimbriiglobus ruber]|uniref:Uncharacterized protein n=1 Tax=Fimbriiglobus ruber TaxID=1908690 RepID=A0A225CY82_9BACT|nr:hypothetical protein [Fimbriiglobus ruber]OWK34301.1 hypothetical protein FRUB_10272 [Fimbriiglobus ruber]
MNEEPPAPKQIAFVRWFDSKITTGWPATPDEAAGMSEMESCGFVVRDTAEAITIALDRSLTTDNLRCTLCIPRVNVRGVQYFYARGDGSD